MTSPLTPKSQQLWNQMGLRINECAQKDSQDVFCDLYMKEYPQKYFSMHTQIFIIVYKCKKNPNIKKSSQSISDAQKNKCIRTDKIRLYNPSMRIYQH